MYAITSSVSYATTTLKDVLDWANLPTEVTSALPAELLTAILGESNLQCTSLKTDHVFEYMLITESSELSQYDLCIDLLKKDISIPHGILAFAGSGSKFHGLRDRDWSSPPGNIYLTASFSPNRRIEHFGPACVALPAVAVVEAIDSVPELRGRAGIKWVNDILIEDAKVAGVLTYSQAMGDEITGIVLGIGLNVETSPDVPPTPFVQRAGAMVDFVEDRTAINLSKVLNNLIQRLSENYTDLQNGGWRDVIDRYRERSIITGRDVTILSDSATSTDEVIAEGRIESIGDNLELNLCGFEKPVSRGRLILRE